MLVESKLKTLQEFIDNFTRDELVWVNGYLNGILSNHGSKGSVPEVKVLLTK